MALSNPQMERFEATFHAHRAHTRKVSLVGVGVLALCLAGAVEVSGFSLGRLIEGLPRVGDFLFGLVPPLQLETLGADLASWFWGLREWLELVWTTLMIAFFGTSVGTILGATASFFAARGLGGGRWTGTILRRTLEVARTVPDLVWALIFMFAFGLGPLAGALAIMLHTFGAQGKLFADVNENVDMLPLEGVRAAGGTWFDEMLTGLLPQVLPNYVSYSLWRFEMNVRSATVVGFVGAGGIGMTLYESLSLGYYDDAGAILLLVFAVVSLNDIFSEWLRLRIAGAQDD